ncbi:MAG: hypothetical protein JWN99_782 [Ilumatobacteraceae bacterium]|nr:hypothetical protein [Ilumatobacteraceae bacterium]
MANDEGWRAADAPGTHRWLRHRTIACTVATVIAVVLIVGATVQRMTTGSQPVDARHRQTVATITGVDSHLPGSTGPTTSLTFSFRAEDGSAHSGRLAATRPSADFTVGAALAVVYDIDHPDSAQVVGRSADRATIPWFVPLALGLAFATVSLAAAQRLRWAARVVRDNPWVMAQSAKREMAVPGVRRYVLRTLVLCGAPDEGEVLAQPLSWRARALDQYVPSAWVAGSDRRFVVAAPGGAPLLRCRRVRLRQSAPQPLDADPLRSRLDGAAD